MTSTEVAGIPVFSDEPCPDCQAPAWRLCYGHCPRYAETPEDPHDPHDLEDNDD